MAADTLTLAMRIKADVDAAVRNFKQFKAEITGVGTASDRLSAQGKAGAQGLSVLDTVTGQLNNKLKQTKTELNSVSQQLNGFKSVRFFALHRINPHHPPLVRVPVNSFEF